MAYFGRLGWHCLRVDGFEADDVIATVAVRSHGRIIVLSGDSDLLALVSESVTVIRPLPGGKFEWWTEASVHAKFGVLPYQLACYKALVGEPGDNITGVRGIGPKKAAHLLTVHGSVANLLACSVPDSSSEAARVRNEGRETVCLALQLATLATNAPLPPIARAQCALRRERVA